MIQRKMLAALAAILLAFVALPAAATPLKDADKVVLHVEGMHCGGCAARLSRVLERIEGVEKAEADHATGKVTLTCTAKVDDVDLTERVIKAGFKLLKVERG